MSVEKRRKVLEIRKMRERRDIRPLIAYLQDQSYEGGIPVRAAAARALGQLQEASAADSVAHLLADSDPRVRGAAVVALGHIGNREIVPALLTVLADESEQVRWSAADALGKLRDRRGVPALCESLEDPHPWVRRSAALALASIGDPGSVEALQRAARKERFYRRRHFNNALRKLRRLS